MADNNADGTTAGENDDSDDTMFQRLKTFKARHGHTKVPKNFSEDMKLAAWVIEQRKQFKLYLTAKDDGERERMYKDSTLKITADIVERLKDVGFELTNKNPRHMRWDFRFQQLKDFAEKYGHTQVPIGWEENVKLANWVSTQRQEYKNMKRGRTSQLNDQRINLLNELGFAWEVQRGGRRRQLASEGTDSKNKSSKHNQGLCILPGKAIVGGKDGAPMEVNGGTKYSPHKKQRTAGAASFPPGQGQQYHHYFQQQQQRFPGAGPGYWQNPSFPGGVDPQQGYFAAPAMNFGGAPFWPNMGMPANMPGMPGMFPPGPYPGYPFAPPPGMMMQQSPEMANGPGGSGGGGGGGGGRDPSFAPMHAAAYPGFGGYPMMPPQQATHASQEQEEHGASSGGSESKLGKEESHSEAPGETENGAAASESQSKSNNDDSDAPQGHEVGGDLDTSDALPGLDDTGPGEEATSDQKATSLEKDTFLDGTEDADKIQ